MKLQVKQVEAYVKELKIHGLVVEAGIQNGKPAYALSDEVLTMISEVVVQMRKLFPKASDEDVRLRALIFVVLNRMGLVVYTSLHVYVECLNSFVDWKLVDK